MACSMFTGRLFFGGFFILFLLACGQKGALYMPKQVPEKNALADRAVFASSLPMVLPDLLWIKSIPVVGKAIRINQLDTLGWQAVLSTDEGGGERYFVASDGFLKEKLPMILWVGRSKSSLPTAGSQLAQQVQRLTAGYYLRFRSLDSGAFYLPKLLASARHYFQQNSSIKPRGTGDFFIDNQQVIDLYIAVEKTN